MKRIAFKCKLLSDVILNRKPATEGSQQTLDFIPGGNFYGIVANQLYKVEQDEKELFTLLHSGQVKFGDAHPSVGEERSYHVPASMCRPKLGGSTYLQHKVVELIQADKEMEKDFNKKQLKQCREGFFLFQKETDEGKQGQGVKVKVEKAFSLKSSYDRVNRRTADAKLFGYESINKGLELIFYVYFEEGISEAQRQRVIHCLTGTQRIGRSRTAQYGLMEIEPLGECREEEAQTTVEEPMFYLYADSRLIPLDAQGNPTCRPTAEDLGLEGCEIDLQRTQIRTFQYAPWNFKRQAYDTDRYGLEKGSVIAVKASTATTVPHFVGAYQTEGFGHVIVSPFFMQAREDGTACYPLVEKEEKGGAEVRQEEKELSLFPTSALSGTVRALALRSNHEQVMQYIYRSVSEFKKKHGETFTKDGKAFASQWGNIRSIAMRSNNFYCLEQDLYDGKEAYLKHGCAQEKWEQEGRLSLLRGFIKTLGNALSQVWEGVDFATVNALKNRYIPMAVVNLASEMAKVCTKKKGA
jgi:hypothetical protein